MNSAFLSFPQSDTVHISIVIGTRDRGTAIVSAIASIQASSISDWELIIADQSTSDITEGAVRAISERDPRVRYVRTNTRGISAARNAGMQLASAPLIAITDDDCEVAPDWLAGIIAEFDASSQLGFIAGTLAPAPFEPGTGYIPSFTPSERSVVTRAWPTTPCFGGNIAVRVDALRQVGLFDEQMGTGTVYPSLEEQDLCHRMLVVGYSALIAPDLRVLHHGFRTLAQVPNLWMRDSRGVGGMIGKEMHYEPVYATQWLLSWWWSWISVVVWNAVTGKRPLKARQAATYIRHSTGALIAGMRHPQVRQFHVYVGQSWLSQERNVASEMSRAGSIS